MLDSFDKGWFVLQTYSGYRNKVKKTFCNVPKLITCLKISCVLIPAQTVNVEKNSKVKEVRKSFPRLRLGRNGDDRRSMVRCS